MASNINPNTIDGTYPIAGQDNNSQGFRDNFTQTKVNFTYAAQEIDDLQAKAVLKSALTGTVLDNNMADNLIYAAKIQDFSAQKVAVSPTSGTLTLNYASGHYQSYSTATAGSVTLAFTNFPPNGAYGYMKLQFTVTDYTTYTLTLPAVVSLGLSGLQGISPGTAGVANTITFGANGVYEFGFGSYDGGSTITVFDLNRALTNFTGANVALTNVDATGYVSAVGNVRGGNINSAGQVIITGNITGGNINTGGRASVGGNVDGGNLRTGGLISATGSVTGGNIFGFVNPSAGTSTTPTILLQSGALMTGNTVVAGAFEYDGTVMYGAPKASNRGVLNTSHVIALASNNILSDNTIAQAVFNVGTGGAGSIQLPASTTYIMEAVYYITRSVGSSGHTLSTLFALGGSLTSIAYTAETTSTAGNILGAVSRIYATVATATAVTANSTTSNENITVIIRGLVRTNAAGSFTPQIKYDSAPGGSPTVLANSWFRLTPIGNNSMTTVGNW
jgi:hypothetical protein